MSNRTIRKAVRRIAIASAFLAGLGGAASAQICAPSIRSCTTLYENCQRLCDREKDAQACVTLKCEGSAERCRATGRWVTHDQRGCVVTTDRR